MGSSLGTHRTVGKGLNTDTVKRQVDSIEHRPLALYFMLVFITAFAFTSNITNISGELKSFDSKKKPC